MRDAAESNLKSFNNFHSISASAETTTIPTNSVDFITVAQAFHWFDREACKKEFSRILKPSGKVVLIWNERLTVDNFGCAYEEHLRQFAKDYKQVNHKNITDKDFEKFFANGIFARVTFPNSQEFDFDGLLGRSLSSSYVPVEGEKNHDAFVGELKNLFEKHNTNGKVKFIYETEIIWGVV